MSDKSSHDYYFNLKIRKPYSMSIPQLLTLSGSDLDIWEWGSWNHITRLEKLPWAQDFELSENCIFVSDVNGDLTIWEKNEWRTFPPTSS